MNKSEVILTAPPPPPMARTQRTRPRRSPRPMWIALGAVAVIFAWPLWRLMRFALGSDLYSYILLIPCVSAYLAWQQRSTLPAHPRPDPVMGVLLLLGSAAMLAGYWFARVSGTDLAPEDQLALTTTSLLLATIGMVAWVQGRAFLHALLFPIGLLIFMIPIPADTMTFIEAGMQHGSAAVAKLLFRIFGTPVFYQDLNFLLPGINLHVAPECSGIRSTIALTIVSVVTGYFFLRSPGKRALLAAIVLPLALARNGFRIFTVGELCVRFGPQMIDSYIHRHGGPIFFVLSLVPLFFLVILLQKREGATTD